MSLFFRDNLTGVIALSTMAAGDGLADIFGRRFGKNNKWSFSDGSKSIAGSAAFFVGASLCSLGLSAWLISTGAIHVDMGLSEIAMEIIFISLVSAGVELLDVVDDNWSVPITAAVLSSILVS